MIAHSCVARCDLLRGVIAHSCVSRGGEGEGESEGEGEGEGKGAVLAHGDRVDHRAEL